MESEIHAVEGMPWEEDNLHPDWDDTNIDYDPFYDDYDDFSDYDWWDNGENRGYYYEEEPE